jgi:hypothetical protein
MLTEPSFRIEPLSFAFVDRIRRTMIDDFGHRLSVIRNPSPGNPCRYSLTPSPPGEELILLSYCPFSGNHPYAEVGPIFIRKNGDIGYQDVHRFPDLDPVKRIFRAYNSKEEIIDARLGSDHPEAVIADLFSHPEVHFIHARALTYGCFTFKICRA